MIKLLVCDLDGTLVSFKGFYGSSWEGVAKACGVYEQYISYMHHYLPQKEKAEEWAVKTAELFRGRSLAEIHEKIPEIPYNPGVREFFKANNIPAGILSSGLDIIARRVAQELGMEFVECTELEQSGRILTGRILKTIPLWSKASILEKIALSRKISIEQVCYVGDHFNDKECLEKAGKGILFESNSYSVTMPELRASAKFTIQDFRELGDILACS